MISGYIIVWFFVFALTILVIKNKGYKGIKKSGVFAGNQAISIGRKMPFALLSAAFIAAFCAAAIFCLRTFSCAADSPES